KLPLPRDPVDPILWSRRVASLTAAASSSIKDGTMNLNLSGGWKRDLQPILEYCFQAHVRDHVLWSRILAVAVQGFALSPTRVGREQNFSTAGERLDTSQDRQFVRGYPAKPRARPFVVRQRYS